MNIDFEMNPDIHYLLVIKNQLIALLKISSL